MEKGGYPNWFVLSAQARFSKHLAGFKGAEVDFLQIGAYTGDATSWLFENILTDHKSTLTDVDTWEGSDEPAHKSMDWGDVEAVYDSRTRQFVDEGRLVKVKSTSDIFFAHNAKEFDFVYVDGDHTAMAALKDGLNGFSFLKPAGILAFDDYHWMPRSGGLMNAPMPGINAFLSFLKDEITVIDIGAQVWLRKNA